MTVCPIALAVGCKKCPAFGFCPLKSVLGDYEKDVGATDPPKADASANAEEPAPK